MNAQEAYKTSKNFNNLVEALHKNAKEKIKDLANKGAIGTELYFDGSTANFDGELLATFRKNKLAIIKEVSKKLENEWFTSKVEGTPDGEPFITIMWDKTNPINGLFNVAGR